MSEDVIRAGVKLIDDFWNTKVRITCEEKTSKCPHNVGDTFTFPNAMACIPELCPSIQNPARPYVIRCAAGVPSWESDDKSIYRIHCVSKKGTVWRLERVEGA
ncbi:hypothetical protein AC482_03885 [miscellaneous Crenarchaeota group-15 archaeon DG-45]|uniref:Uncharacterized protein n=1 Tax=miscellaneous Crenarchaeota group-15 archaeon DG-45 TaxID=1685127 RepID=A0A0M0BQ67_9ARCH|nr:MAG: hypothetical protein AC482_03885 [miscellaneous Crenarchaeota group-15 archaeon DG-45]